MGHHKKATGKHPFLEMESSPGQFQKICYSSKKVVFINVRKEFVLPAVYEIGNGSLTPQPWIFKIILHDRRKCKSDCRFVVGEIMLAGLPFIEEITQEKNLEIALRHADFLIVQPIQAFPFDEVEKNIRNDFIFLKELSLAVKKCAKESIKIIVISPYTGIFEYLIMKISDTPGEQISGLSRYAEARAVHYIAQKLKLVENDGPPYGYALASSFLRHFRRIIQGSEKISSMIAMSDGSYQIPEGIFAAFPVKICGFSKRIEIVKDMDIFTVTMNRINQFVHRQRRIYCFIDHIIEEEGLPEVEKLPETTTDEDITDAEGEDMLFPNLLQKKKLEKIKGNKIL